MGDDETVQVKLEIPKVLFDDMLVLQRELHEKTGRIISEPHDVIRVILERGVDVIRAELRADDNG
ncbi:MAG: hypothetical protein GTO63_31905 [Anaerolineae bacterium]|nr:hypothetical protein [Anaerolineae bacterium]NIN99282.1 hypothetical protein [Anaerolineae bacterium]NIQ82120.1 hypothetical protein [Anaerolineae bacterium]